VILAPMPAEAGRPQPRTRPRVELPPYLEFLRIDAPLLSREQEAHLFRKMNYLKFCASKIRSRLDPRRIRFADVVRIEQLLGEAGAVKNQIIAANLRLVIAIAKKNVDKAHCLFELVSDGNMSLIHAVEKFDYSRGFKFSTYASWAILRNFARSLSLERRRRDRFPNGFKEMPAIAESCASGFEYESDRRRNREVVHGMLGRLNDRERRILVGRFGLGGSRKLTLGQIGSELGLTKERVRQIELNARQKLYRFALEMKIDPQAL
jgi:RNA polymerase primary sigma factor